MRSVEIPPNPTHLSLGGPIHPLSLSGLFKPPKMCESHHFAHPLGHTQVELDSHIQGQGGEVRKSKPLQIPQMVYLTMPIYPASLSGLF